MVSEHQKRTHAICSASSASRWLACPGSVSLCKDLPEEPTNEYAAEGTRAHELAEKILTAWLPNKHSEWPKKSESLDHSEEMREHVHSYTTLVCETSLAFDEPPHVKLEVPLTLDQDLNMYGTADVAMTGLRKGKWCGVIIDLKYGKTRVVAKENPQLAYYAVALLRTSSKPLESVQVMIVQPRIDKPVTTVDYAHKDLMLWSTVLIRGAEACFTQVTRPSIRTLVVGSHCKWCKARYICPEKNKAPGPEEGLEFI